MYRLPLDLNLPPESSQYGPLRPTKLDKIKNLHAEIHTGAVDIPSWGGDVAFPN